MCYNCRWKSVRQCLGESRSRTALEVGFAKRMRSKLTTRVCGQIRMEKSTLLMTVSLVLAVSERREEILKDVF